MALEGVQVGFKDAHGGLLIEDCLAPAAPETRFLKVPGRLFRTQEFLHEIYRAGKAVQEFSDEVADLARGQTVRSVREKRQAHHHGVRLLPENAGSQGVEKGPAVREAVQADGLQGIGQDAVGIRGGKARAGQPVVDSHEFHGKSSLFSIPAPWRGD